MKTINRMLASTLLLFALSTPLWASETGNASVDTAREKAEQATTDMTSNVREQIITEALEALNQTTVALHALDSNEPQKALAALEKATGKLDLLLAREPSLALAPVDVRVFTTDLYASKRAIEDARESALKALKEGDVQQARQILSGLASEMEIQVVNLPMASYPEAIKAISPLIDAGKFEEAKAALQASLNTLVIDSTIVPLPLLRAQMMLQAAEELAENRERTQQQSMDLHTLLDSAREQLELAEALGYGHKEQFEPMYKQIELIHNKTKGQKSGTGLFDKLKSALKKLKDDNQQLDKK